ncbi:hypothetical protein ACJA23_02145 [Mycoplasma corogypsi]|uniref:hypothetical protein n=1 Tax=Mycoplasma corogypsi TaxID=2106 RepID=UPI00387390EF
MKNRKFRLILSAGVSLAIIPTMIAASCGSKATTEGNTNSETSGDTSNTNADGDKDKTNPSEPTTPETDGKDKETKPTEPVVDPVAELNNEKTKGKSSVAALENLSATVKTSFDTKIDSATTKDGISAIVEEAKQLDAAVVALVAQVTESKKLEEGAKDITNDAKTKYQEVLKAAQDLLTENKLNEATATKAKLEEVTAQLKLASTNLSAYVDFSGTLAALKTKLEGNVDYLVATLKDNLLKHVTALETSDAQVSEKVNKVADINRLLTHAESLKGLVSEGIDLRTTYPKNYYNSTNKAAFDKALNDVLVLYPAYNFNSDNIESTIAAQDNTNPRVWGPKRSDNELQLVNYVKEVDGKVVKAEETDLKATADLVAKLEATLKTAKDGLDGETRQNSPAYFKNPYGYMLSWNRFLPNLSIPHLPGIGVMLANDVEGVTDNGVYDESKFESIQDVTNRKTVLLEKFKEWFSHDENLQKAAETLTKTLGSENFNNVKLSEPKFTFKYVYYKDSTSRRVLLDPIVTLTVTAKDNTVLKEESEKEIKLQLRDLRDSELDSGMYPFELPWVYFTASPAPSNQITTDNKKIAWDFLNQIVNYDGPTIPLDASSLVGKLGVTEGEKPTVNNTSTISSNEFNETFKAWFLNQTNKFQYGIRNYIHKLDNRFNVDNVDNVAASGIFVAYPDDLSNTVHNLRYRELPRVKTQFALQQVHSDKEAVYLPMYARTQNGWLRIFLIRIPLSKFVKPVETFGTVETAPVAQPEGEQPAAATAEANPS